MQVEDTIRKLRERANHEGTPKGEAETCRTLAEKLESRLGKPKKAVKRPSEDLSWAEDRIDGARAHAASRAAQHYGQHFDLQRWNQFYDKSIERQKKTKSKFDAYRAFEHARKQYEAEAATDIRDHHPIQPIDRRLHSLSDLELGSEVAATTHRLLELQTRLADLLDALAKPLSIKRNTAKARMQSALESDFAEAMQRFRHLEAELRRRSELGQPLG